METDSKPVDPQYRFTAVVTGFAVFIGYELLRGFAARWLVAGPEAVYIELGIGLVATVVLYIWSRRIPASRQREIVTGASFGCGLIAVAAFGGSPIFAQIKSMLP